MTKEVTIEQFITDLPTVVTKAMSKDNGLGHSSKVYCDCLDWNEEFKKHTLEGWADYGNHDYHIKEHTTGVTPQEVKEFYNK